MLICLAVAFAAISSTLQGCGGGGGGGGGLASSTSTKPTTTTPTVTRTITTTTTTEPSPFQKYINNYTDACKPWLSRSTCTKDQYKGLVFFLHGYSACAIQAEGFAPLLNDRCFDVAAPTFPGHGKAPVHDCNAAGANCTVRWTGEGGNMGFDLSDVPTHASQYFDFVNSMVELVQREHEYRAIEMNKSVSELDLSIGGLSVGGGLATYAAAKHPGIFSHLLLINPFFGAGQQAVDEKMRYLAASRMAEASLLQTLMPTLALVSDDPQTALAGTNDKTLHKDISENLNEVTAWDSDCLNIFHKGRMGFCAFQGKYGAAAHSAGMHALVDALSEPASAFPITQIITTEQDGMTRNGWTYSLGHHIYGSDSSKAAMCMYRFKPGTKRSDPGQYYNSANVVPHANLDPRDNPDGMWWKDALYAQMVNFLSGSAVIPSSQSWDHTKEQCVGLPLADDSFPIGSWMNEAVLPGATPSASSLGPGGLQTLLNFDNVVRIPCHTPLVKRVLEAWVDCSALGTDAVLDATVVQV